MLTDDVADILDFDCPRCGVATSQLFYGPCAPCVAALRATVGLERSDLTVAEYTPKMNVTPNFVATKD